MSHSNSLTLSTKHWYLHSNIIFAFLQKVPYFLYLKMFRIKAKECSPAKTDSTGGFQYKKAIKVGRHISGHNVDPICNLYCHK